MRGKPSYRIGSAKQWVWGRVVKTAFYAEEPGEPILRAGVADSKPEFIAPNKQTSGSLTTSGVNFMM